MKIDNKANLRRLHPDIVDLKDALFPSDLNADEWIPHIDKLAELLSQVEKNKQLIPRALSAKTLNFYERTLILADRFRHEAIDVSTISYYVPVAAATVVLVIQRLGILDTMPIINPEDSPQTVGRLTSSCLALHDRAVRIYKSLRQTLGSNTGEDDPKQSEIYGHIRLASDGFYALQQLLPLTVDRQIYNQLEAAFIGDMEWLTTQATEQHNSLIIHFSNRAKTDNPINKILINLYDSQIKILQNYNSKLVIQSAMNVVRQVDKQHPVAQQALKIFTSTFAALLKDDNTKNAVDHYLKEFLPRLADLNEGSMDLWKTAMDMLPPELYAPLRRIDIRDQAYSARLKTGSPLRLN